MKKRSGNARWQSNRTLSSSAATSWILSFIGSKMRGSEGTDGRRARSERGGVLGSNVSHLQLYSLLWTTAARVSEKRWLSGDSGYVERNDRCKMQKREKRDKNEQRQSLLPSTSSSPSSSASTSPSISTTRSLVAIRVLLARLIAPLDSFLLRNSILSNVGSRFESTRSRT